MTPKEQLSKDKEGRYLVPLFDINTVGRARQDMGDIAELANSIKELGLIQPIIIDSKVVNNKWNLVAGGRRCLACAMAQILTVPCLFKEELTELQSLQMELAENVQRKDMEMLERIALTEKIDRVNRAAYGSGDRNNPEGWTQKKTAVQTKQSEATVSLQIQLHKDLESRPALKDRVQKTKMPFNAVVKLMEQVKQAEATQQLVKTNQIVLTTDLLYGDARVLIKQERSESHSLLLWDPPFGNQTIADSEGGRGEHGSQQYTSMLEPSDNMTLQQSTELIRDLSGDIARVLKPNSHFYVFHAEDLLPVLKYYFEYYGLIVVRPVLIWKKTRNTNAGSGYNYMSYYEPIMFGYKPGPSRRRLAEPLGNILEFAAVGNEKRHGFQKPIELLCTLIKQSTLPGESVFDPTAGSGSTIEAARACGRSAKGYECSEKHFHNAQNALLASQPTI